MAPSMAIMAVLDIAIKSRTNLTAIANRTT
jgi:hypothetical protein